ncbi:hypothetical protein [Microbacterium sp.]|uniref:hypothetical protein n=1 Tax=Microbacterium sp. TaxID=51671 RepID=UPI0025CE369D|nr:hypothetical protein [Microbacterium sp.]MBT9607590.1 hypothetical protein [Microbacterium sp.]
MSIQDMTPDERLSVAAIIMRDAIEKHDAEAALKSAESPRNSQQATPSGTTEQG